MPTPHAQHYAQQGYLWAILEMAVESLVMRNYANREHWTPADEAFANSLCRLSNQAACRFLGY